MGLLAPGGGSVGLGLGKIVHSGLVQLVMADWTRQPFTDHVALDVVQACPNADCDEGVLQRQGLQYRLISEQQLGHFLVEDERLVRRINDARQIDTDE